MNQEEMKAHVLLARNGDTASFCKLYELYYKDMYRFAYYTLGNTQDAEDVISETVLDAFTGIRNLKNPLKFKAWIFQILTTKCKRQMAVYVKDREHRVDEEEGEKLAAREEMMAEWLDVRDAFMKLSEMERTVLSMLVFAGYNSREAARALKSREGTIRSVKSRALSKLADYLKEEMA